MSDYISREAVLQKMWNALYALEDQQEAAEGLDILKRADIQAGFEAGQQVVAEFPAADVRPVVLCKDCKYWRDEYVKQNDGTERQYTEADTQEFGLLPHCVTSDVGINMGAMCRYEDARGWDTDKSVFRQADDFCSRGERRPCSYEEWWGIVDGVYPKHGADMREGANEP